MSWSYSWPFWEQSKFTVSVPLLIFLFPVWLSTLGCSQSLRWNRVTILKRQSWDDFLSLSRPFWPQRWPQCTRGVQRRQRRYRRLSTSQPPGITSMSALDLNDFNFSAMLSSIQFKDKGPHCGSIIFTLRFLPPLMHLKIIKFICTPNDIQNSPCSIALICTFLMKHLCVSNWG